MADTSYYDLYKALKADGAVQGDWRSFHQYVGAPGKQGYQNRKKLYDALKADGAVQASTYEEFNNRLFRGGQASLKAAQQRQQAMAQQRKPMQNATRTQAHARNNNGSQGGAATQQPQTAAQRALQMVGGDTDYMKNWQLLHKRNDQMTPTERMQANTARSRMQQAQKQAYQQEQRQKNANPISQSKVNPHSQSFNETMQALSSNEAKRDRAVQQRQDDATNAAEYEVSGNEFSHDNGTFGPVAPQIDAMVAPSMTEADDLSWKNYQDALKKAGNDAYLRNKAWKDLQDNRIKNRQEVLAKNLGSKLTEIYSDKGMQRHIMESADKLNMGMEEYVDKYVTPQIMNRAQSILGIKNIEEVMPKSAMEYVVRRLGDSILGTLSAGQDKSKEQIAREQEAMAISDDLQEMPTAKGYDGEDVYRSGVGGRFVSTAANMMMDSPILGMTGGGANLTVDLGKQVLTRGLAKVGLAKAGAQLSAKQLGFKIANMSMAQKVGSGLMEGTAKGALNLGGYSAITSALGQASTGKDTSMAALAEAGLEGFKHGATTGAMFGASGAVMAPWISKFGIDGTETTRGQRWLHGAQKVGAEAVGLGAEAGTMMIADNVTGDKDISVGQWLEDVVMVGAFKAGEPSNYGKISQALYHLTHNTSGRYTFGKDSDGKWRTVDIKLTDAEKGELINSTSGKNLMDAFSKVDKTSLEGKDNIDKNITKLAYKEFMADPTVSQSTKEKVNAAMGLFNTDRKVSQRSVNDVQNKQILEYADDGTLLTCTSYKNAEQRRAILFKQKVERADMRMMNLIGYGKLKGREILDSNDQITPAAASFLNKHGYDLSKEPTDANNAQLIADIKDKGSKLYAEWVKFADEESQKNMLLDKYILDILSKDPMKRTDEEMRDLNVYYKDLKDVLFPEGKPNVEQSTANGQEVAEENNLGTEQPNNQAVLDNLHGLTEAENEMEQLMNSNDIFSDNFKKLQEQGLTHPQIYDWMIQNGMTEEDLAPYAKYMNTVARVQGMQNATAQAIEENAATYAQDWSYRGTLNGMSTINAGGGSDTVLYVEHDGKEYIVGSGDVSFGEPDEYMRRRAKENVGDMLVCLDPATGEIAYLPAKDVYYSREMSSDELKEARKQQLQQINSVPYNQAAQEQAAANAAKPQPKEEAQPKETVTDGNQLGQPQQEDGFEQESLDDQMLDDVKPIGKGSFGDIYDQFKGNALGAIKLLLRKKSGEAIGALHHKDVGDIDLVWGKEGTGHSNGFGLAKLAKFHPEVLGNLQEILDSMHVTSRSKNRINLESDTHKAAIRLEWDGKKKNWLLTAFKKENASADGKTTDTSSTSLGGDTALSQTEGSPFDGKDTNISPNNNENNTSLTFKDGSAVPVDANGEPDFMQMTPEQGVEVYKQLFPKTYEAEVDNTIKMLEADLKKVQKATPKDKGLTARAKEQAEIEKAVSLAEEQLARAKEIKKAIESEKIGENIAVGTEENVSRYSKEREQGYRIGEGGVRYDRQKKEDVGGVEGKEVEVAFSPTVKVKGHAKLVELDTVQASHNNGQINMMHFGPDWQPKDRTSKASRVEAEKIAGNIDPKQITGSENAFIGSAPSVNERHETIQGNNRVEALRQMYSSHPEQAAMYKQWLMDHADDFGLSAEDVAGMKKPVIVNELPVDDAMAKKLGQMAASGFESGGSRIPDVSATINKIGAEMQSFANELLAVREGMSEETSLGEFINSNAERTLEWLYKKGFIDNTEYENLYKDADKRRDWLNSVLKTSLFDGDRKVEAAFNNLPAKAKRAVLATFLRDMKSGDSDKIKTNIKHSFEAFNDLESSNKTFKNAKNLDDARRAVQAEVLNGSNSVFGDTPIREKYTNFELELAALYKGIDQKTLTSLFNRFYDEVQGPSSLELHEQGKVPKPLSKDEAIEKVFETNNYLANDRRGKERQSIGGDSENRKMETSEIHDSEKASRPDAQTEDGKQEPQREGGDGHGRENAEGRGVKSDEKESSTNPVKTIEESADAYRQEKIDKAAEAYKKAKESGDEEQADKLAGVETDAEQKIDDYIAEHYPHHNGVRARTKEEQAAYDAETEAMKNDETLKQMRKEADEAFDAAKENVEGRGVKPDEKESSTNPVKTIEESADAYRQEKIDKAAEAYKKAKESGDEEQTTKAAKTLKHLMDENLKGKGYSLRQRQAAIALQVGKKEAETIDKPFKEMDLEEREFTASKNPLTESEINELTSDEYKDLIPAALDYLHGNTDNMVGLISYLKIWNDVRSRHENAPDNSGAKDGAQLAPADNGSGEGLGLGTGRDSGGSAGQLDRGTGDAPASRERGSGESGENDTHLSAGEQGDKQGEGTASRVDDVSARGAKSEGGSKTSGNGNVPERGGQKGGRRPAAKNAERKPTAKQGTHFSNSTAEQLKKERAEYEQKKKDFWERWKKAGQGYVKIAFTPFKRLNLSPKQIEMLPELLKMHLHGGFLKIKEGLFKFNEWKKAMLDEEGKELKMIGLSDEDIDRFIDDYWNAPFEMDGEKHTLGQWSSIYGGEKLREKLAAPLNEKYQKQMDAEPIKVKVGDRKNIEETLPYLLPQQQEDVYRAETQFFGKEHADREHAYGKGYMFTNGTGTGKTYTGLGIAKRLVKQGKKRILFVTPSQKKVSDWIKDGKNLGLDIRSLDDWAKERGTTATTESGDGCVITTFANFGLNKKLLETEWDAVIYDESHRIMENKNGTETARGKQHYKVTNRDENHCFLRLQDINPHYQKMQNAADEFAAQREKERKSIIKEYKQNHPGASTEDCITATSNKMPKDLQSFVPADSQTFPKLGKLFNDFKEAQAYYYNKVKPELEQQAKDTWKNTKTVFLSATPFNTRENLDYAEGYIFKYPEEDPNSRIGSRARFYLDHFGAAYKWRYNRLESSVSNPDAVAKQEVAFSDYLQNTLGTMSGRIIDSPYDYSRDFPTVAPDHADEFNNAVQECLHTRHLYAAYQKTIGDYNYGSALFETMKVANIISRIKEHLDAGRKVVIYHRRVETKEPIRPPFEYMLDVANRMIAQMKDGKEKEEFITEANEFRKKHQDLLQWEQTLDYSMPREQIAKVFGKNNVLFFSGKESKKVKDAAVDTFNSDDSGKNILVIQEASGKEGISLHDTTGKHQRVVITLALPQSPITALQIEGRIYRIGNMSNAIFEYPILGLNSEMMLFGQKFNNQVSTTENLALGSQARNLRDSFAKGILEHSGIVPIDQQGVGGKAFDAPKEQGDSDPFDDAVLDYYSNQKLNKNNREGNDYFPTPEPLGYKMVQWAGLQEGDSVLEPSAGHGAIARYVPQSNELMSIEPSMNLFSRLQLKAGGLGRKFLNNTFENYDIHNKHDAIIMNPPFEKAGALAMQHIDKAFKHLDEGGRIVAIIPMGSAYNKYHKWLSENKDAVERTEILLPDITFQQAGTSVRSFVAIIDKVSNASMRDKAGASELINLAKNYDKVEDFFEDLRNMTVPDRIIDTNFKIQKKSRQTVKDLKDIKGVRKVDMDKNGINVKMKGWMEYAFSFVGSEKPDFFKKKMASYYQQYKEFEKDTWRDEEKAVFNEFQHLACKLAGMTEEEMERFIKNGNSESTTHFRTDRGVQYSKTDKKDVKNSRIIPEDVDKSVSSQIEKKFDETINDISSTAEEKYGSDIQSKVDYATSLYSNMPRENVEYLKTYYENEIAKLSRGTRYGRSSGQHGSSRDREPYLLSNARTHLSAIERELAYRDVRAKAIRDNYGLQEGRREISPDLVERIFKEGNPSKGQTQLFAKAFNIAKRLGVDFALDSGADTKASGETTIFRDLNLFLDGLVRTRSPKDSLPRTMLHEMLHQATMGAINLVKKGKAEGMLTPKQIEGVKTILDLYDKVKDDKERFKEEPYGLKNEYEFAAQMADPRQRKALGLDVWDRIKNAAKELANKGDRSMWQTFKDAIKKLFEISDKDKMDQALNDIMDDFNEKIDDISMNEIEQDGFAYKVEDKDELDRLNKEDRELFDSLNIKRNTRKDYNDTVTELARRLAGEDGGTEENVSSRHTDGGRAQMGRSDERFVSRPNGINLCAAKIIAHDVIRRSGSKGLSNSKERLELGQEGYVENSSDVENGKASSNSIQEGVASPVERDISSRIENWAKQNNAWFDWRNLRGRFDRDSRLGTGDEAESDVYLSKDGKSVLKIVRNPHAIYDSLLEKINSIELHNELFPDDAINIIGFTKVNEEGFSTTSLLLEQPFVDGKTLYDSFDSQKEKENYRNDFMGSLGFTKERWASTSGFFEGIPDDVWKKGDYAVEDVNAGNIIIDKNSKPHIIDCVVRKYKDAIKDKAVYDSTEEKKQIKEQNRFKVNQLESSLKNEQKKLVVFAEVRNERNKEAVDRMINEAKEKIKVLKKQIKELESSGTHFREDKPLVRISDDAPVVVKHVDKIAKQVGGKVNMVQSVDEITDKSAKAAIERGEKITGWYDEKTGEVHLYMPNIHDRYTAEKTIWHEVVGHKGMRELFGDENYSKFLRSIWYDLDKPENARLKELVSEELRYNPFDFENGIEEGIARLVEDGKGEPGFWNAIKNKVTDILHEIGYRIAPNTKDVKYLLWLSKNLQKNPNDPYWKMKAEAVRYKLDKEKLTTVKDGEFGYNDGKVKRYADFTRKDWEKATDMTVHFRTSPSAATEIDIYNRAVGNVKAMAEEAYSDKMNSVLELYKAIDPSIKRAEDVKTSENPYMLENLMSSRAQKVGEAFVRDQMNPLTDAFDDILGSFSGEDFDAQIRNANLYMVKKSGLERNRAFFVRDAIRNLAKDEDARDDANQLQKDWDAEHQRLKGELDSKRITLKGYFDGLDDFIRKNVDADYDPNKNDYSGFHEMQEKTRTQEIDDALIQDEVKSAESSIGDEKKINNLWNTIKAATDYSLDMEYTGGFMDRQTNQHVKGEMNWYVPMRMFDKETAEDIYGYIEDNGVSTDYIAPALMRAKGRTSMGDLNILAQIGAMGEHAINRSARNAIKQALARFVNANEKAPVGERLVTELKPWLEKVVEGGVETWVERYPQIADDATQLEISQAVEKFENDMKAKELKGEAKQVNRRGNIPYRFADKAHRPQHIVDVWVNGRKKSYIINGNPRAAQAINGMLNHKGAVNILTKSNRWLSQVCTSYNPEFTVRNAVRDYGFASHTLLAKEGVRYFMKFEKHYAALGFAPIANAAKGISKGDMKDVKNALFVSLFKEYKNGTLDVNKSKYHKWFKEFMDNGGETGYMQMKNVDAWKKQIETAIKDKHKGKLEKMNPVKAVGGLVEDMNQMAENIARFATFCASREVGRNATRSAYDAKEVSVNFNRSGSAENVKSYKYEGMSSKAEKARNAFGFSSCYLRNYTMFFNASVQSFKGLSRNIKNAPAGTIASMVAAPMSLGLLMPLVNQMLVAALDDDEKDRKGVKDPYAELPEYVRRNNVCIYVGKGRFVQIPIAIEGRAFYGLGDIAASYSYKKDLRESRSLPLDIANQLSQIVPVGSFMESSATSSDSKAFLASLGSTFLPSAFSPAVELIANRDWKGQPIYNDATYMENAPAWKKAYSGTSEMFLWTNKKVNALTNDVDPGNEDMKGSKAADLITNPFVWEQVFSAYAGGLGTSIMRGAVTVKHALSKDDEVEVKDIPFARSFFFTPSSQTSLQRTKSKWYNYKDEVEDTNYNLSQLKHDMKDPLKAIRSAAAAYKYLDSPKAAEVNIVNDYDKRIDRLNKILKVVTDNDTRKSIEAEKDRLMMEAVDKLDELE